MIGQIVRHTKFGYRGVIYDIDTHFSLSDAWYEQVARSRPPKDRPWYRVLVHGEDHETYVAERHLEPEQDAAPIDHPRALQYFDAFKAGQYVIERDLN